MSETKTVSFGGRSFAVAPFAIGASRKLARLLDRVNVGKGEDYYDAILDLVREGLMATDATLTVEQFEALHTTLDEVHEAYAIITAQAGFKRTVQGDASPLAVAAVG